MLSVQVEGQSFSSLTEKLDYLNNMELIYILEVIQLCDLLPALHRHIALAALASARNEHATIKMMLQGTMNQGASP